MIQPHHLHTHGPEPLYTPVKADDVRPKIDVRKFDLDDKTTWPDPERDGEYVLVYFGTDSLLDSGEYPYEIKLAESVPNYHGVVAWVPMKDFFNAIEKELGNGDGR